MSKRPAVVFQPEIQQGFLRGINQIVEAIRPTLGPVARHVAINRILTTQAPELLDEGGIIARRIIELPQRTDDAGAMLLRQMLWQLHETVGDGTATAAVIFQSLYASGVRYLSAGGNAMPLRQHFECAVKTVVEDLDRRTIPLTGGDRLIQAAESISHDPELASALGDIFDVIGPFGRLDIRSGHARGCEVDFIDGTYWQGGVFSERMIHDKVRNARDLQNVRILITDLELDDPRDLIPALQVAVHEGAQGLILVARTLTDQITGLLVTNERPGRFDLIAVHVPGMALDEQTDNLTDLAVLTGGTALLRATGSSLTSVTPEHLGRARRAWADGQHFGVVGGQGDVQATRAHLQRLRARHDRTDDLKERRRLQQRIAGLLGGAAVLKVAGVTESEHDFRRRQAERTADALRGALYEGVLPGGGAALLACQPALRQKLAHAQSLDERAAYQILLSALEAPLKAIAQNAGYEPTTVLAQVRRASDGCGFDVTSGELVDMVEAGIFDSAAVVKAGLRTAVRTAALALTADVLIQRKNPPQATTP